MPVKNVKKVLSDVKKQIDAKSVRLLHRILSTIVAEAKKVIIEKAKDTGNLSNAIEKEIEAKIVKDAIRYIGRVFINESKAPYGYAVHEGRKPGSMPPPIENIRAWMLRNKVEPNRPIRRVTKYGYIEYMPSFNQLAIMISKSIGRKGKAGIRFFDIALKRVTPKIIEMAVAEGFSLGVKRKRR